MTIEVGNLIKALLTDINTLTKTINDKQQLVKLLRKECVHEWQYDYTCGHKGEDYYVCKHCGAMR
jgi:hypothetical protein